MPAAPASARKRSGDARTEAALLASAERVFADKGFFGATVADIVKGAGVSRGTFYLYFKDREDVFLALLTSVVGEMFVTSASREGPIERRVESGNRAYLEAFRGHRDFMRSVLQVATFHPDAARALGELRAKFMARLRAHLENCQASGRCHDFDARIVSYALVMMVEFCAYGWLAFEWNLDEEGFDFDAVVGELSALWCRAIYKA